MVKTNKQKHAVKEMATMALALVAQASFAVNPGELADTQVTNENIDRDACAVWTDGAETKEGLPDPHQILWRRNGNNRSPYGEHFGRRDAKQLTQHLRYAFKEEIPVGAILSSANDRVSVLKPSAKYPGDMDDESQWITGEHLLKDGEISRSGMSGFVLWVFPEGTKTRAVRYTHAAQPLDSDKRGWINTILLMPKRRLSLGRFAKAYSNQYPKRADRLNDGQDNGLHNCWSNLEALDDNLPKISKNNPGVFWLAWPEPVEIDSLVLLHCGCGAAEVDIYSGPKDRAPGAAREDDWKYLKAFSGFEFNFPWTFPNFLNFDKPVKTRAVRVRVTGTEHCRHPHVAGYHWNDRRVVVGEVLALGPLGATAKHQAPEFVRRLNREIHPPIPIRFELPEAGNVTLVLEDKTGRRLCNLVCDKPYPVGKNVFWWDGSDDLGRDLDAANHGLYRIPYQPVAPGDYVVRGLYHGKITPRYEFECYISGRWASGDNGSDWLSNHGNPQAAAYCPGSGMPNGKPLVFFGALVTEGLHGIIWVDMDGVKRGGMTWVGGNWLAAPYLCSDLGPDADSKNAIYTAAVFDKDGDGAQKEVRINALRKEDLHHVHQIARLPIIRGPKCPNDQLLDGTAIYNRRMALALNKQHAIWIINTDDGSVVERIQGVQSPRGLAYDPANGTLWAISDDKVGKIVGGKFQAVVKAGLDHPRGLMIDRKGNLYVSEGGDSNQIKVYERSGALLRTVGRKGKIESGPYIAEQMRAPHGMAVDCKGRLWVAENFNLPKRCSLWSADGKLVKTWFGHAKYGEGGTIDGHNPRKWYYAEGNGMMEFDLDWRKGEARLVNILAYAGNFNFSPPGGYGDWGTFPERATYHEGRRFLNNSYNNSPVAGPSTMSMYTDCGSGRMRPCVSMGDVATFRSVLEKTEFKNCWPDPKNHCGFYIWCDRDNDGKMSPAEVKIDARHGGSPIVQDDMSITIMHDNKAKRLVPEWQKGCDAPLYSLDKAETLCEDIKWSPSDGGNYVLADSTGVFAMANSAKPYPAHSLAGGKRGMNATWSIPSYWPGLHASHSAPTPKKPGELIGTVRVMGPLMRPKGSKVAPIWLMSGNTGSVYAFTQDGLFITSVFGDERQCRGFGVPEDVRGLEMSGETIHSENFWTTATCSDSGTVFMTCRTKILSLLGFGSLRPIAPFKFTVTKADLEKVRVYRTELEAQRRAREGSGVIQAPIMSEGAIKIDGSFDDWNGVTRVNIEQQGAYAFFDSSSHPFDIRGGVAVSGDRLCAVWATGNRDLLSNSNENPTAPFKTGGCLDLMLGLDASAQAKRTSPVPGDIRFLVTLVDGKPKALVYRQKMAKADPARAVAFKSPVREVTFDQIDDVSDKVQLAKDDKGRYEVSVPLAALGWKNPPKKGQRIKADIGVLRAENGHVNARHYWANKATAITADLPSEAELQPGFWGELEFQ